MSSKVFHVGFRWVSELPDLQKIDKLEQTFSEIGNWCRLSAWSYCVETLMSEHQILQKFQPRITLADSVFIFAIDLDHVSGWAPPWFWEWLREKKANQPAQLSKVDYGDFGGLLSQRNPPKS